MRTADDVRHDPQVGDVAKRGKHVRLVSGRPELREPWVTYTVTDLAGVRSEPLSMWREWAAHAEVLRVER